MQNIEAQPRQEQPKIMQVNQAVQYHVTSDGNDKWINTTVEQVDCGIQKGMQTVKVKCRTLPVTIDKIRPKPEALGAGAVTAAAEAPAEAARAAAGAGTGATEAAEATSMAETKEAGTAAAAGGGPDALCESLGNERERGTPDPAFHEKVELFLRSIGSAEQVCKKFESTCTTSADCLTLKDSLTNAFPKEPRESVCYVKFDTGPNVAIGVRVGHVHPIHLTYTHASVFDFEPYMPDVIDAVREIITHGIDFTLYVHPVPFPLLSNTEEGPGLFAWGPDNRYASFSDFIATLTVVMFIQDELPQGRSFPNWLIEDLSAIPAKYEPTSGPIARCSKLVKQTMVESKKNREMNDFMLLRLCHQNGWRDEKSIATFIAKHNTQVSYADVMKRPLPDPPERTLGRWLRGIFKKVLQLQSGGPG